MLLHRSNGSVCEMAMECDDDDMMEINQTSKTEDLARQKKYGIGWKDERIDGIYLLIYIYNIIL
jgi:hypothetical protein